MSAPSSGGVESVRLAHSWQNGRPPQNTITAVVNPDLIERLQNFEPVAFRDLQRGSVQLWLGKEREFELEEFPRLPRVYRWNLAYDEFLGVMKGVLELRGFLSGKESVL